MIGSGARADRAWILGCTGLAAGLRLFRIGHQSLWVDETISLGLATYANGSEFWTGLLRDIHGPFTSALLHEWVRVGEGEGWLRLLYAIPSVATVPWMGRLGTELIDRRAGRAAALACALSPFHVWYGQEVRNYSWALLWITGSLVAFVRARDGRAGGRGWLGLGAVVVLGLLTNYSFAFLLAALTLVVLAERPFSRRFALRWGAVLAVAGVVFLPWFLDWARRIGAERVFLDRPSPAGVPLREAAGFRWADVAYVAWTFAWGYTLGPSLRELHLDRSAGAIAAHAGVIVPGAAIVAIAGLLGLRAARERGRLRWVLVVCGVPLGLAVLLAARDVKTFHPRYLVAFFPVFVTVLAAGFSRPTHLSRAAAAGALVLAGISLGNHYFDPAYGKEDSRGAARFVVEHESPGDSVVVIYAFRPFRHYFQGSGGRARLHHVHKRFLRTDEAMREHVREASDGAGRVWLVLTRWWDVAPEERIRAIFEESLEERERWDFEGVRVTLYERRAA